MSGKLRSRVGVVTSGLAASVLSMCATGRADEPVKRVGEVVQEAPAQTPSELAVPHDPVAAMLASLDNCLWERPKLGGSLCGLRYCLAENGVLFDADLVQVYQGVSSEGLNTTFKYGGHADYVLNVDMDKAAGLKGLFFKMRTETLFGEALGFGDTATILPPSLITNLPRPEENETAITNFLFTQFFSESFGVFFGKMDTLDGDANAFAHGRGKDQFMNSSLVFNPIGARTVPYSTLGVGFVILQERQPIFTFSVVDPVDSATTSGFDSLYEDGVTLAAELRLPTNFFCLPGHQLFGAMWSSRDFAAVEQDPRVLLPIVGIPSPIPIAEKDDSWAFTYNFDQYLAVDPCDPTRGWGVFGRAGISDGNPNPLEWFVSAGIGGSSPICGRERDTFGIGYFHLAATDEFGPALGSLFGDTDGVELFYNVEVTPWFHLTADLQIIDQGFEGAPALGVKDPDPAVIVGLRGKIDF
jgi:porin